jgi:putative ABC transport system permease protein
MLARTFYRALLLAFPADLRRRRGDAMLEMFLAQLAEVGAKPIERARLWRDAIADALRHGLGARMPSRLISFSWSRTVDNLIADIRYTLTSARRSKGFFATALLTLALGIGVTTAMMSAAYAVLLKPLPYPESERIVTLGEEHPGAPPIGASQPVATSTIYTWRTRLQALEEIGMFGERDFTVTFADESVRVHGGEVSPSIFDILRVTSQRGRFFIKEDDVPGAHDFVVLSDRLWRQRFNASDAIVGQTITVDHRPHRVVGVAKPGFAFPDDDALMWTPFDDPTILKPETQGGVWLAAALGRMKPGATLQQVEAEGTAAARAIPRHPVLIVTFGKGGPVEVRAQTLIAQKTDRVKPAMLVLVAGVVIVLLVGCANVTNLLLARGITRERELVLRTAIGASRGRLVRQLLTESFVLAMAGGALGLALGAGLLRVMASVASASVPRLSSVTVDATTFAIAAGLSVIVAMLAGLMPALRGARVDLAGAMRGADGAVAAGFRGQRANFLRRLLLTGETALAVMLLVGAALLGRSFFNLMSVDPGYSASGVLSARAYAPETAAPERIGQFMYGLLERLRSDGRVIAAGAGNMMPLVFNVTITSFPIPAAIGNGTDVRTRVAWYIVTPGYAEALGLRLRAGRLLTAADIGAPIPKAIVNDEFVRLYLSPDRVVGLQLPPRREGQPPTEIVGVVAAQKKGGNDQPVMPEMYVAAGTSPRFGVEIDFLIKTSSDPAEFAATVRSLARDVDKTMVIGETMTMERRVHDSVSQPRFAAALLSLFATVALMLAAIGVYGVLSYSVSQRSRELAIRSALGAGRKTLLRMVLGEGLLITAVGGAVGLAASALLTRLMTAILFGVNALDPVAFLLAPAALLPVAVLACLVPAAVAARTDPSVMLRM